VDNHVDGMTLDAKTRLHHLLAIARKCSTLNESIACKKGVEYLENYLPQFFTHPASRSPLAHHHYVGGLAQHTCEVIQIGLQIREIMRLKDAISYDGYFMAALFHDAGKVPSYYQTKDGTWVKTQASRMFHHIYLSTQIFQDMMAKMQLNYPEEITHAILAHHGCREWGSPVAPATPLAQLLHHSDMMSARMNGIINGVDPLDYKKYKEDEKS